MTMTEFEEPLSASKLKQFGRCPESFDLKYVQRFRPEGGESIHLKIGDAVHDSIEAVLKSGISIGDQGLLADRLRANYRDHEHFDDIDGDDEEKVYDCLTAAAKYLAGRDIEITGIELPYQYRFDSVDHDFGGYIDVTTTDRIIDWKTGKSEGKESEEVLQAAPYVGGYAAYFDEMPERVDYVYLNEGKVRTLEPSDEMYQKVIDKAESLLSAIELGQLPGDPEDSKCYWCDFEVHCTTSPLGVGNVDWRSYP